MVAVGRWCVLCGLALVSGSPQAATQQQIDQAWNRGLAWLMTNQHGDGGWSSTVLDGNVSRQALGLQATAQAIHALAAIGLKSGYTYMGGVTWLANAQPVSVDALARQTIALKIAGQDVSSHASRLIAWRNPLKAWGAYPGYESALPDTGMGISALLDAQGATYSNSDIFAALCQILPAQRPAPVYLWPYSTSTPATAPTSQTAGAILPSTYAVQALVKASTRIQSGTCGTVSYTLSVVIANAITGLVAKKNADNGFGDSGTSGVLETAAVLRALKSAAPANVSAATAIDYLVAAQGADGSWGPGDALQTAEALSALAAATTATVQRPSASVIVDTDKDGVPDAVEVVLLTNPSVADSRYLADGAGSVVTPAAQMRVGSAPQVLVLQSSDLSETSKAAGSPTGWDRQADLELFVVGASVELAALEAAARSMFAPEAVEELRPEEDEALQLYRAFYGKVPAEAANLLAGKSILLHFSAVGGSYAAVGPLVRAEAVSRMAVGRQCRPATIVNLWRCPAALPTAGIPDAGLSEVVPTLHVGSNAPAGSQPLSSADVARLDARPVNTIVWAAAVSHALRDAGLRNATQRQLASLMRGEIRSWKDLDARLPAEPVIVCRMLNGAQPAANALVLGAGCSPDAPAPAAAVSPATGILTNPNLLVHESGSTAEQLACLNTAHAGGHLAVNGLSTQIQPNSLAIGIVSLDNVPGTFDRFDLIALDGVSPSKAGAQSGEYQYVSEAWMHWRKAGTDAASAPSELTLTALQTLRALLADTKVLEPLAGIGGSARSGMDSQLAGGGDNCGTPPATTHQATKR